MTNFAAIFDMDGTLIDNNVYHFKAYQQLFENHGLPTLSQQTFNEQIERCARFNGFTQNTQGPV